MSHFLYETLQQEEEDLGFVPLAEFTRLGPQAKLLTPSASFF